MIICHLESQKSVFMCATVYDILDCCQLCEEQYEADAFNARNNLIRGFTLSFPLYYTLALSVQKQSPDSNLHH